MEPFTYVRAESEERAVALGEGEGAQFIAGGTTMVDLLRLEVLRPSSLVDISGLSLDKIEDTDRGVRIGALVSNTAVAHHPSIGKKFPVLTEALLSGASPQLRNMATVGGNLLQRTRCPYFRDGVSACNKRSPGTGCAAQDGYARSHAVLGTSIHCIATHPSDMCVALVALDAIVHTRGPTGSAEIPISELHVVPGDQPHVETTLARGELVTHVELPVTPMAVRSRYVKVRDRAEFAFALVSVAVALDVRGKTIHDVRIALGGIATKPWRAREAERELVGKPIDPARWRRVADVALAGAAPRPDNAFKTELAKRTIVHTLQQIVRTS